MALGSTRSEEMRVRLWLPFSIATSMVSSHESVQYMFLPNQSTAIPVEGRKVKRPFHDKERTDWQIVTFGDFLSAEVFLARLIVFVRLIV